MELLNTRTLKSALKLSEKRDALLSELAAVEKELVGIYGGNAPAAPAPVKASVKAGLKAKVVRVRRKSTGKRGALKEKVLAALRSAGDKGVLVKELADNLGVKNQNMHVWFSSTGKKLDSIQKVGPGKYRIKAGA